MKNILLFGVSCVGKTTIGRGLAKVLGWQFFDMDDDIIRQCQCTIQEFVDTYPCLDRNEVRRKIILMHLADPYDTISFVSTVLVMTACRRHETRRQVQLTPYKRRSRVVW